MFSSTFYCSYSSVKLCLCTTCHNYAYNIDVEHAHFNQLLKRTQFGFSTFRHHILKSSLEGKTLNIAYVRENRLGVFLQSALSCMLITSQREWDAGLQVYVDVNSNIFNIAAAAVYVATAKTISPHLFPKNED